MLSVSSSFPHHIDPRPREGVRLNVTMVRNFPPPENRAMVLFGGAVDIYLTEGKSDSPRFSGLQAVGTETNE